MADKTIAEPIYRVIFNNQGTVYELYTLFIYQSEMYGFVEVEELIFDDSQIDETDNAVESKTNFEKLKLEFTGVKRCFIPMTSIIRIDELEKPGAMKAAPTNDGNVRHFPSQALKRPPINTDDTPDD